MAVLMVSKEVARSDVHLDKVTEHYWVVTRVEK